MVKGAAVGFIVLNLNGPLRGYIQAIGVVPQWRNRGIGRKLLAFAEWRIFRKSPNVFLCVSSFNTAAQRLYRRLGYKRVGELKDYVVRGHSARASWVSNSASATDDGTNKSVTIPGTNSAQFFRLRRP